MQRERLEHRPLLKYEILLLIAKHGSASRVAKVLGLTQPTVTFHMKSLESSYGIALFDTVGRRITLTDAGKALLVYAERMVTYMMEAERVMDEYRSTMKGRLLVGASAVPATYLLPAWLAFHYQMHPDAHLDIQIMAAPLIEQHLEDRTLDLGMIAEEMHDPNRFKRSLERWHICTDKLVLVLHPSSELAANRQTVDEEQLERFPLVLHSPSSSTRKLIDTWTRSSGLELNILFELPSAEAVKQAVLSGIGAAILSEMAVRQELASGLLVSRPLPGFTLFRDIVLLYHRERYPSPLFEYVKRSIIEWAPQFCKEA